MQWVQCATGDGTARYVYADMGIDFAKLIRGDGNAVKALAALAGADPRALAKSAFRQVPGGQLFAGELFLGRSLLRTVLRV